MSDTAFIALEAAIRAADLSMMRAAMPAAGLGVTRGANGASLLGLVEQAALESLGAQAPDAATQQRLARLEAIFIFLVDAGAADSAGMGPFFHAWWSDALIDALLARQFDPTTNVADTEGGEFGLLSLCARRCAGPTIDRLIRSGVDTSQREAARYDPVLVACAHLNVDALRYMVAWGMEIRAGWSMEELTREAIGICAADAARVDQFRGMLSVLVAAGVQMAAPVGRPSALATALQRESLGAMEALLDAGADPQRVEPGAEHSIAQRLERADNPSLRAFYLAWQAKQAAAMAAQAAQSRAKTFDSVLHDPCTCHQTRPRLLN